MICRLEPGTDRSHRRAVEGVWIEALMFPGVGAANAAPAYS